MISVRLPIEITTASWSSLSKKIYQPSWPPRSSDLESGTLEMWKAMFTTVIARSKRASWHLVPVANSRTVTPREVGYIRRIGK